MYPVHPSHTVRRPVNYIDQHGQVVAALEDIEAWKIRAFAALLTGEPDVGWMLKAQGYQHDPQRRQPSALVNAAEITLRLAERCRAARWGGTAPPRLGSETFEVREELFTRRGVPCGTAQSLTLTTHLADALGALGVHEPMPCAVPTAATAVSDRYDALCTALYAQPSVAPAQDEQLATQGYTTTEHLVDAAVQCVLAMAAHYEAATGSDAVEFCEAASQASVVALAARQVIKSGIAVTLKGAPSTLPLAVPLLPPEPGAVTK